MRLGADGLARFELVTAGHHFLLNVLPFRHPESRHALDTFVAAANRSTLPLADIEAVLLRCLALLNGHTGGRLPSLVDRYLMPGAALDGCVARFSECVDDILRYRGIGAGIVQHAMALVSSRYVDSQLTTKAVAAELGVRLSTLCAAVKRQTARTLGEYIRDVRLNRAAQLLVITNDSIKEIWAQVGYNYASNFDRDFKQHFHRTPREYRALAIRPSVRQGPDRAAASRVDPPVAEPAQDQSTVLLVDEDECTTTKLGACLGRDGYCVRVASTGAAGLDEAARAEPDAIVLDYHLHDMSGLEVLRAIRRRRTTKYPAVAVFTADWSIFDRAYEVQALDAVIVSKLCDLDHVKKLVVDSLVRTRSVEAPAIDRSLEIVQQ
jgi:AraC-like DNA-binding protein/CheY-like chemotaxis protein